MASVSGNISAMIYTKSQNKNRKKVSEAKDLAWKSTRRISENIQRISCTSGWLDHKTEGRRGWRWHYSWVVLGPECRGKEFLFYPRSVGEPIEMLRQVWNAQKYYDIPV